MSKKKILMFNYLDWYKQDISFLRLAALYCVDENGKIVKNQLIYTTFVNVFLILLGNILQTVNLFVKEQDVISIASSAYVVAITWLCTINFYYMFKHRKLLTRLFADVNLDIFQPTDEKGVKIVKGSYQLYKTVKNGLLMICTGAVLTSVVTPILRRNESVEVRFSMKLWYPFDIAASPVYEIIYLYNCLLNIYSTIMNIYLQIMVGAFTTFIGAQCDLLCHNMNVATNLNSINKFIYHHQCIIDFKKRTESMISSLYLFIFAASNISVCMTLFLLKMVDRSSFEFIFLMMYSFGITFQLFLPCWFSSEMNRKSERIPYFVYSLPWHDASIQLRKKVYIFIVTTQEYIILEVMNLFPLSVDTFVTLMKSSFSYYTVLIGINGEEN